MIALNFSVGGGVVVNDDLIQSTLLLPRFDPSQGTLDSATVDVLATNTGALQLTSGISSLVNAVIGAGSTQSTTVIVEPGRPGRTASSPVFPLALIGTADTPVAPGQFSTGVVDSNPSSQSLSAQFVFTAPADLSTFVGLTDFSIMTDIFAGVSAGSTSSDHLASSAASFVNERVTTATVTYDFPLSPSQPWRGFSWLERLSVRVGVEASSLLCQLAGRA